MITCKVVRVMTIFSMTIIVSFNGLYIYEYYIMTYY